MKNLRTSLLAAVASTLLLAATSGAVPYNFSLIQPDNGTYGDEVGAQLAVDVTTAFGNAMFHFTNAGPLSSTISEIYFDDHALGLLGSLTGWNWDGQAEVWFEAGANPTQLPGGSNVGFVTTTALSTQAVNPAPTYGVDPGEYLDVFFSFDGDFGFDDLIAALDEGDFRIGLHVISQPDGQSNGYVNGPPVPEPATLLLLGSGVGCLVASRVRGRRKAA